MKTKKIFLISVISLFCFLISNSVSFAKKDGEDSPKGWGEGKKVGWEGESMPPGLFKKEPAGSKEVNREIKEARKKGKKVQGESEEELKKKKKEFDKKEKKLKEEAKKKAKQEEEKDKKRSEKLRKEMDKEAKKKKPKKAAG